ncbi:MAG: carboxypeptidase regulatory-like domain-containing protein, partial [Blastocatellia bacterium]|nr:carboxypeptidase regulatory-like domain-containing protein [Blastocatellia bacterium]
MTISTRLCTLFISIITLSSFISAQTTSGSIAGSVIDANQAAVANATIKITDEAKNYTLTMTSDAGGRFVFPQVPPATYTMSIEAKGF